MLRIGLTGGIGAGKSAVASRLGRHGAMVVDADRIAREVVAPGTAGLAAVAAEFGTGVLRDDATLDRAVLGARVFGDDAARARLNAIVHPLIAARTAELVAAAPPDAVIVHDVPLLVENGLAAHYHLVVVVEAPVALRLERLRTTRSMATATARARMAAQASDADRRAVADIVVVNDGPRERLRSRVDALWSDRIAPYAANLVAQRAPEPPPRVVPYDLRWPAQYRRAELRLRAALGGGVGEVRHIGSTAVPGLTGRDVLDVGLTVAPGTGPDDVAGALAGTGWVVAAAATGRWPDPPDAAPFARHADPGQPAHLHVGLAGGPSAHRAVRIRDYLRCHPAAAQSYAAYKLRLAADHADDPEGYQRAKNEVLGMLADAADRWVAERR